MNILPGNGRKWKQTTPQDPEYTCVISSPQTYCHPTMEQTIVEVAPAHRPLNIRPLEDYLIKHRMMLRIFYVRSHLRSDMPDGTKWIASFNSPRKDVMSGLKSLSFGFGKSPLTAAEDAAHKVNCNCLGNRLASEILAAYP